MHLRSAWMTAGRAKPAPCSTACSVTAGTTEMSTINLAAREINFKIVYYGPGLSGKTTNLQKIYDSVPEDSRGEMVNLATEDERTLFFDFLPLELGKVSGFRTRFHLYTVPGQVFYNTSSKFILQGSDGIVFLVEQASIRTRDIVTPFISLYDTYNE